MQIIPNIYLLKIFIPYQDIKRRLDLFKKPSEEGFKKNKIVYLSLLVIGNPVFDNS